jgi:hypothetical protein
VRTVLIAVCALTAAASAWLGVMAMVLHHAGFERIVLSAALFILHSLLVVAVTRGWVAGFAWRMLCFAGAAAMAWTGFRVVIENLSSTHFEGYALVIGLLLILQALLTPLTPSSKVHQFVN